ncbi:hypothetical protein QM996_01135 [Sinorhizobium chiapasense]
MSQRTERQKQELRLRLAQREEDQRQQIIRDIESIRRDQLPIDRDPNSLSDQIIEWQEKAGLRQPSQREGLSIGLKKTLFDRAMEHANPPKYGPNAWQGEDGNFYESGLFGTVVPAKQLIPDMDDFERSEREDRAFKREADAFWNRYRIMFPDDDPQAIAAAMQGSGFSRKQLLDIASDENTRFVAAQRLHAAIEAMQAQDQQVDDGGDEEGRSDGLGSGVASTGHVYTQQQPEKTSANSYGPMGKAMIEMQKKMGVRKW